MLSTKTIVATSGGILGTGTVAVATLSLTRKSSTTTEENSENIPETKSKQQKIREKLFKNLLILREGGWKILFELSKKKHLQDVPLENTELKKKLEGFSNNKEQGAEEFKKFCQNNYLVESERSNVEKLCFIKPIKEEDDDAPSYPEVLVTLGLETREEIIEKIKQEATVPEDEFLKQIHDSKNPQDPYSDLALLMQYCAFINSINIET